MAKGRELSENDLVFKAVIEQVTAFLRLVARSKKLFKAEARALKNMHDSLIEAGFTEEQATQIVACQGLRASIKTKA